MKELVQREILSRPAKNDLTVTALDFDSLPLGQPDSTGNIPR